jgi:cytochrome P450
MPFGGGPRICPGKGLAILEMKAVLSMVCQNFEVIPPKNGKRPSEEFKFVVAPVNLWARLKPISRAATPALTH